MSCCEDEGAQVASRVPQVSLSDATRMPLLGFGTSDVKGQGKPGEPAYEAIQTALKCGYRFIDTAALYGNEELVGRALKDAIENKMVAREQLFVCTKVWCTAHKRVSVVRACRESLRKLQLDYVDLYLVHWPMAYVEDGDPVNPKDPRTGKLLYADTSIQETWQGMEDCKDLALAKSIGLSNFNHKQCEEILATCKHRPTVNQVELHPYLAQKKLLEYSRQKHIVLNAYCPLGAPNASWAPKDAPVLIEDPLIKQTLARKHNKTAAQIILRYHLQLGIAPIPKSITPERIRQNIQVLDFELDASDMRQLLELDRGLRYCTNTAGEYVDDHPLYPFHEEY